MNTKNVLPKNFHVKNCGPLNFPVLKKAVEGEKGPKKGLFFDIFQNNTVAFFDNFRARGTSPDWLGVTGNGFLTNHTRNHMPGPELFARIQIGWMG